MRAALYYRVSSPGQVDAFGFAAQRRLLPEHCARVGWSVVGEYEEPGISGEHLVSRPAMMRLLADAERDLFDVILVVEDTRLCRGSLRDWEYIKGVCAENDISLATPQGIFYRPGNEDDDFLTDIRGAFSKREKRQMLKRMHRGRVEATAQGCLVQGEAPYGYCFERVGRRASDKRLVVVPEAADVVRLVFELTAHGTVEEPGSWGSVRVCEYLNEVLQVPSPRGRRWLTTAVKRMIRNPVYRGEWYYGRYESVAPETSPHSGRSAARKGGIVRSGEGCEKTSTRQRPPEEWRRITDPEVIPPIVTPELWEAANGAIDHRNKHGRGRPARNHPRGLLTSYLRCPHCGYAFHHYQQHRKSGTVTRHYLCAGRVTHRQLGVSKCGNHRWPAEEVETRVWGELARLIQSPELLAELAAGGSAPPSPAEGPSPTVALQQRLREIETATERVRAAYRAGIYSLEVLQSELETLRAERQHVEEHLQQAAACTAAAAERERQIAAAVDLCAYYREQVRSASHEQKRQVIETLIQQIHLRDDGTLVLELVFGATPAVPDTAMSKFVPASRSRSIC